MPETNIVKKIHKWKPFTGRPVGRPKFRWEDDVRNDLKKMKLIKWTEQVQDHLKWKEKKLLRRPRFYQSCSAKQEEKTLPFSLFLFRFYFNCIQHTFFCCCSICGPYEIWLHPVQREVIWLHPVQREVIWLHPVQREVYLRNLKLFSGTH